MKKVEQLKVKIFADGAEKSGMLEMAEKSWVQGLTTNPTLMRKVGISDYKAFAMDNSPDHQRGSIPQRRPSQGERNQVARP